MSAAMTECPHVLQVWREVGATPGQPWRSRFVSALVPCRLKTPHEHHAARKPNGRNWTWR